MIHIIILNRNSVFNYVIFSYTSITEIREIVEIGTNAVLAQTVLLTSAFYVGEKENLM